MRDREDERSATRLAGSVLGSNEASRMKLCRCAALMGYRDQPALSRERDERPFGGSKLLWFACAFGEDKKGQGREEHGTSLSSSFLRRLLVPRGRG